MVNADRGEVELEVGGQTRLLRFLTAERQALETALGRSVLAHLAQGGGETVLLVNAITCGLARTEKKRPSPATVQDWLDDYQGDVAELQKRILYAIARGMPKQGAAELVRVLDDVFGRMAATEDAPEDGRPSAPPAQS